MPQQHFDEFEKHIQLRDEHKKKAEHKRKNASKLPIVGTLDEWLAKRHESKAAHHESLAFESAEKHAQAVKTKQKL
ncbi:MAG: hypothetical protein NUV67_02270 [archaeon]|nr:hypothetical protein [archaeon]